MILSKPTLIVNRLIVTRQGRSVIDLTFHAGLNVVHGENSAGKTTTIRFLAYALGAESIHFNQYALLCDETFIEVAVNGTPLTLRRAISQTPLQSLSVFWGTLDIAAETPLGAGWQVFPFRRSESKESFSQILFRALDLPELRGEGGANITMHQLIRLMYSDQETPSGEIFRFERFDSGVTRAAIGDYLLGIDNNELYELRLRETSAEKALAEVRSAMRSIYATFGASGTNISLDFLDERIATLASELTAIQKKLDGLKDVGSGQVSAGKEDNRLRADLASAHAKLSALKQRRLTLETTLADSELFLTEIEERIANLEESSTAATYLGTAVFSFCPSCFATLQAPPPREATCRLCKGPVSPDSARSQLARMRNELALQQRESRTIRESNIGDLESIKRELPGVESEVARLEAEYKRNAATWRSPREIEMQALAKEAGAKEQEIRSTLELKKLASLLDNHNKRAGDLEAELDWIRGRIEAVGREQTGRRQDAYLAVATRLKDLLRADLPRQPEFSRAEEISIDFGANRIAVDRQQQFSASSMVYLRHSFHLALLLASTDKKYFRYPRFAILDGIEDGGMEPERSFNFQDVIRRMSSTIDVEHQIILATSHIFPDLNRGEYVVGRYLTHDHRAIDIK